MLFFKKMTGMLCLVCLLFATPLQAAEVETATASISTATGVKTSFLSGLSLRGKVLKTVETSRYICLLAETRQGRMWLALPKANAQADNERIVQIWFSMPRSLASADPMWRHTAGMPMEAAQAQTLWRILETSVFGAGLETRTREEGIPSSPHPVADSRKAASFAEALEAERSKASAMPVQALGTEPVGSAGAMVPSAGVKVEKASGPNSYLVAECFAQAKELHGKTVRVRGKVVKVSRMIMGKNWLHIQDGSGDPAKKQHDLVVTSLADPPEQSVVTVEGVLSARRDFGAGYVYEAIIEDARVER